MLKQLFDPCSIVRVQTWDSEAATPSAVDEVLGVTWPKKTGVVVSGRADVICVGPTDWLVVAADRHAAEWLQRLEGEFHGSSTFRATDMSHALARIQLDGPEVRDLLAKGCSLDLYPPLFPPGRSARTRFAGMPVIVRCEQPSTFECIVSRSYADYLLCWLADASVEFSGSTA
jgi:sarcosine oxidase, subunit gamma